MTFKLYKGTAVVSCAYQVHRAQPEQNISFGSTGGHESRTDAPQSACPPLSPKWSTGLIEAICIYPRTLSHQ